MVGINLLGVAVDEEGIFTTLESSMILAVTVKVSVYLHNLRCWGQKDHLVAWLDAFKSRVGSPAYEPNVRSQSLLPNVLSRGEGSHSNFGFLHRRGTSLFES